MPGYSRVRPPRYPKGDAAAKGGEISLIVTVQPDGSVGSAKVAQATPDGVFDESVLSVVSRWKFQPQERGVPVNVLVPLTFMPPA